MDFNDYPHIKSLLDLDDSATVNLEYSSAPRRWCARVESQERGIIHCGEGATPHAALVMVNARMRSKP